MIISRTKSSFDSEIPLS